MLVPWCFSFLFLCILGSFPHVSAPPPCILDITSKCHQQDVWFIYGLFYCTGKTLIKIIVTGVKGEENFYTCVSFFNKKDIVHCMVVLVQLHKINKVQGRKSMSIFGTIASTFMKLRGQNGVAEKIYMLCDWWMPYNPISD